MPPRDLNLPFPALLPTLLLGLVVSACAPSPPAPPAPAPEVAEAPLALAVESHLTEDLLFEHVAFLASDEMRGRNTPSPELERAADYLGERFEAAGLEPAGDDGSFFQLWPFEHSVLDPDRSVAGFTVDGTQRDWRYGDEYFAIPGPSTSVEGTPIYAGDPATVTAGLPQEANGGIVVISLPEGLDEGFAISVQAAMMSGAAAIVLIMSEETPASDIFQLGAALEAGAAGQFPIPTIGIRYDIGEEMLQAAGLGAVGARDPPEILEEVTLSLASVFEPRVDEVRNVVGLVRGADPELAETYVVLTAHYDHVGVGPPDERGDSIFSGADDNASGTSALLQIAAAFGELEEPPARSVLFLAVSGEEKGLLGSAHFASSPTVPLEGIVANLNMDMVGRSHPDTVYAIGEEYTTIGEAVRRIASERPELGLVAAPDPEPEEQAFLRSDHYSFVEQGIPALMLTTWLHDDYHLPSDTPDRVDADKLARVARLGFYLAHELASDPAPPSWTQEGEELLQNLPF